MWSNSADVEDDVESVSDIVLEAALAIDEEPESLVLMDEQEEAQSHDLVFAQLDAIDESELTETLTEDAPRTPFWKAVEPSSFLPVLNQSSANKQVEQDYAAIEAARALLIDQAFYSVKKSSDIMDNGQHSEETVETGLGDESDLGVSELSGS